MCPGSRRKAVTFLIYWQARKNTDVGLCVQAPPSNQASGVPPWLHWATDRRPPQARSEGATAVQTWGNLQGCQWSPAIAAALALELPLATSVKASTPAAARARSATLGTTDKATPAAAPPRKAAAPSEAAPPATSPDLAITTVPAAMNGGPVGRQERHRCTRTAVACSQLCPRGATRASRNRCTCTAMQATSGALVPAAKGQHTGLCRDLAAHHFVSTRTGGSLQTSTWNSMLARRARNSPDPCRLASNNRSKSRHTTLVRPRSARVPRAATTLQPGNLGPVGATSWRSLDGWPTTGAHTQREPDRREAGSWDKRWAQVRHLAQSALETNCGHQGAAHPDRALAPCPHPTTPNSDAQQGQPWPHLPYSNLLSGPPEVMRSSRLRRFLRSSKSCWFSRPVGAANFTARSGLAVRCCLLSARQAPRG